MVIHLKDAADAKIELERALDREKRVKEYVRYRSRREVFEEVSIRGFVFLEKLDQAREDEHDARLLLVDVVDRKVEADKSYPSYAEHRLCHIVCAIPRACL